MHLLLSFYILLIFLSLLASYVAPYLLHRSVIGAKISEKEASQRSIVAYSISAVATMFLLNEIIQLLFGKDLLLIWALGVFVFYTILCAIGTWHGSRN